MSDENTGQTKSEEPTAKKKADSKKKGQVARSRELNTSVMLLIGVMGLWFMMAMNGGDLQHSFSSLFKLEQSLIFDPAKVITHLKGSFLDIAVLMAPFFFYNSCCVFSRPTSYGWLGV